MGAALTADDILHADGSHERVAVGPDLRDGQRVQVLIPGGTFHTARVIADGPWFLGASTEWPAVVPGNVELGSLEQLAARHPDIADDLRSIASTIPHAARTSDDPR
jgi:predicted cupin superfamily sugar epimerase